MKRLKPEVDIVLDLLKEVAAANPGNSFAQSILVQYQERGGLSKKQLQGLYGKAERLPGISTAKLATFEAIILRKNEKTRSPKPEVKPLYEKDEKTGLQIRAILERFPEHKQVKYLQAKYENNEPLTSTELLDLQRITKALK
jgi:hypothetical protein